MKTSIKKYNVAEHRAARQARREAVIFLVAKGYTFKAAGYAVGRTGEFARACCAKQARRAAAAK